MAALVDMERFQQLQEDRNAALQAVRDIWGKMQEADAQEVQEAIKEAVGSARNQQIRAKA